MAESWQERARQGIPVFALFFLTLFFFSDILLNGRLFIERDLQVYFISPCYFWLGSLKSGEFPLWNPLSFGGHPFFATLQPGVLYPPNILYFLLPFNAAFNWIIISHFFLAGAFTYAFLRFLRAGRASSFLGAAIFLLGGYLLSVHSLLSTLLSVVWAPLIFLLFGRALRLKSLWSAGWAGIVLAISFLGGGIEVVLGVCAALGLMVLFHRTFGGSSGVFGTKALLVTGSVFVGLSAIQLGPFLELTSHSIRKNGLSYFEATTWSASPIDLLAFFVQDPYGSLSDLKKYWIRQDWLKTLYVGGLPFFLLVLYMVKEKKTKYFWLVLGAFSLFIALGGFNPLYPYLYKYVPGVSKIRYPVKFLFLGVFALCVMAGMGLQHLLDSVQREEGKRIKWAAIVVAMIAALALLWLNVQHDNVLAFLKAAGLDKPVYNDAATNLYNFKRMLFYFVLACSAIWLIIETHGSRYAVAGLCLVLVLDLFGNLGYYVSVDPRIYWAENWTIREVKPSLGEYRVFTSPYTSAPTTTIMAAHLNPYAIPQRLLAPSLHLNYAIRNLWGSEVIRVKRTDDLYNKLASSKAIDATRIMDFFSTKYIISTKPISSPYYELVGADIEGLKGRRSALLKGPSIKIYRNKRVLPRAFIVPDYHVEPDPAKSLERVSRPDFDPVKTVVLEETPIWDPRLPSSALLKGPASAKIVSEKNNGIDVQAHALRPALLYLSDTYFPGWNAYVDGTRTKIYRANYNFRAVPLPPGDHHVEFRYEPLSFYLGAAISAISLVVLIGLGIRYRLLRGRRLICNPAHRDLRTV